MERRQVVLTAVGPDRTGLVNEISQEIHQAGCNLEDSRMALLAGEFALIALCSGDIESIGRLELQLGPLGERLDFRITLKPARGGAPAEQGWRYRLRVVGVDQPGIVHEVSAELARLDVSVTSLESRIARAAFSGTPLFNLTAELHIQSEEIVATLRSDLERACEQLDLTWSLEPIEPV